MLKKIWVALEFPYNGQCRCHIIKERIVKLSILISTFKWDGKNVSYVLSDKGYRDTTHRCGEKSALSSTIVIKLIDLRPTKFVLSLSVRNKVVQPWKAILSKSVPISGLPYPVMTRP